MREEAGKTPSPGGLGNGVRVGRLCYQVKARELSASQCSALCLIAPFDYNF